MNDVYVMLGNRYLKDRLENGTNDESYVALIVNNKALDNTYRGFLEDCCEALASNNITQEQRPVYLAAREAAFDTDANVAHEVLVYDRSAKQGQTFGLDERVNDTAGEYLYVAKHDIGGQETSVQTLELYVLAEGAGGH